MLESILAASLVALFVVFSHLVIKYSALAKKNTSLESALKEADEQINILKKKHEINPSYDAQMVLAEVLSGNALFKIERIDTEQLYLRRR